MAITTLYEHNGSPSTMAEKDGFEFVDLEIVKPTEEALRLTPGEFALKNQLLPIAVNDGTLIVAIASPESLSAVDELGILLQMPTRAVVAGRGLVKEKIE